MRAFLLFVKWSRRWTTDSGTRLPDLISGAFGPTWIRLFITVNHPTERTIGRGGRIKIWGVYIRDLAKSAVGWPGVGGTFFLFTNVLAVSDDDSLLDAPFARFFFDFFPSPVGVSICLKFSILDTPFGVLSRDLEWLAVFPPRGSLCVLFVWVGGWVGAL